MDPSENGEPPQSEEDKKSASPERVTVIASITISLLLLIVGTGALLTYMVSRNISESTPDPNTRIERNGYTNLDESIGDPSAIVQGVADEPVYYQKTAVVDACSLLRLETVRQQNLLIAPGVEPGEISRHYFDGSSDYAQEFWQTGSTVTRELNDCNYPLVNGAGEPGGNLHVTVYQPAYASNEGIRNMVDDYLRGDPIGDVARYNRVNTPIQDNRTFYVLQKEEVYVGIEFDLGEDSSAEVMQTLLESVASQLSKASGPAQYSYKSQTFSGEYISACQVSDAADVTLLFDAPASPSIQERLSTATGIVAHEGNQSNFISNQCIRRAAGERPSARTLTTEINSYDSETAAKAYLSSQRNDSSVATKITVGDESFFSVSDLLKNALYVRIGATTIALSYHGLETSEASVEKRLERLLPIAQAIADRMKGEHDESTAPAATEVRVPLDGESP